MIRLVSSVITLSKYYTLPYERAEKVLGLSLSEQIGSGHFLPEIYVYPPFRTYDGLEEPFDLHKIQFSDVCELYVHIPFCPQLCSYCGFVKVLDDEKQRDEYVDILCDEILLYKDVISSSQIETLHFGGGTPSLLSIEQMEKIMETIRSCCGDRLYDCLEISMETTPSNVDFEKFRILKDELGFNRVSMGVQSLKETEIRKMGRHNFGHVTLSAVETLREIGYENIVCDLMIGLEGQTPNSFEESVREMIDSMRPDCVEIYSLGVVPHTLVATSERKQTNSMLGTSGGSQKSAEDIVTCFSIARDLFLADGYIQDCHNRYALENRGSFIQEDNVFRDYSLIGFGAATRTYAKNVHYRNHFFPDDHNQCIVEYMESIKRGEFAVSSGVWLDEEEKMRQYCVYHIEDLSLREFDDLFGKKFQDVFPLVFQELKDLQFIDEKEVLVNERIKLNQRGLNYRDLIGWNFFSEFAMMREMEYRPRTFSKKREC